MTRRFAMILSAIKALSIILLPLGAAAFSSTSPAPSRWNFRSSLVVRPAISNESNHHEHVDRVSISTTTTSSQSRRSLLQKGLVAASAAATNLIIDASQYDKNQYAANAAVGTLPEFADTNAICHGLTIDVTDSNQYEETIEFFTKGFEGMKVLRERGGDGGGMVKDTWLGFGPETPNIPPEFELPVSSLSQYGGHSSLHIRYDPFATTPLYKRSSGAFNNEPAPGNSIAYLQLGVPQYRISQMVKYGGNVLDAYGWVNVVSPSGLPVRGIVGITADPMMFLAVNCVDVAKSEEFYAKLGFVRQEYPYARLNKGQGQFEPPQPPKSVYVAPSPNSMGILLLQNKNRKKAIVPNPVLRTLNVVYAPSGGNEANTSNNDSSPAVSLDPVVVDPSSVPISFIPVDYLEKEIKATALPMLSN
mmetsp:Transcript_28388/g.60748  ORF Transcript_28388/g.60748 Transcript_28388/m.60748 type:complete len:418 (+) Transcript_28388:62-1315(+)